MFKKLVMVTLIIQVMFFGSLVASAEGPNHSDSPAATQTQNINNEYNQTQNDNGSNQTQGLDGTVNQDQTIFAPSVNSGSQDQNGNVNGTQNQSTDGQDQSIGTTAQQTQSASSDNPMDANQSQNTASNASQSQATSTSSANHDSIVTTDQNQAVSTQEKASTNQGQFAGTELNQSTLVSGQNQDIDVNAYEKQNTTSDGAMTLTQEQIVEAKGQMKDANGDLSKSNIKASTKNIIEILKEQTQTLVHILQQITINDHISKMFDQQFVLSDAGVQNTQEFNHTYDWGTLHIKNIAFVGEDTASMESSIAFDLAPQKVEKPRNDWATRDDDHDGLPNYYELYLGTDPEKADTDGDGLTDLFEVTYEMKHFQTNQTQKIEFKWLNPLKKDTNGNGIGDAYEDYDHDYFCNGLEQMKMLDPFVVDSGI